MALLQGLLGRAGRLAGGCSLAGAWPGAELGPCARVVPTFFTTAGWPTMKLPLCAKNDPGAAVATAALRTMTGAVETCSLIVAVPQAADTRAAPQTANFNRLIGPVY
jgi:hypothetical protein